MKLMLLAVGKVKNESLSNLCEDYLERIKNFFPLKIIEVKDYPVKGSVTLAQSQEKESELLKDAIPPGAKVILLDEKGKEFTTQACVELFTSWQNHSVKEIVFILGGAYGFSPNLKKSFEKMALSQMTFTHEMSRLLLLEQIYRVGTIMKGMKYHHA